MRSIGNRIAEARKHAGMTQTALAEKIGVAKAAVSQWENGLTRCPTADNMLIISQSTGYEYEWIITGAGKRKTETIHDDLPVLNLADTMSINQVEPTHYINKPNKNLSEYSFSFISPEDFPEHGISSGSYIVVEPQVMPLVGDYVLVVINNSPVLRKLFSDAGTNYLRSLSTFFNEITQFDDDKYIGVIPFIVTPTKIK